MGRLNTRTRRGVFGRALLVFALLLAGPALGFGWLGWNSLQKEHAYRVLQMRSDAETAIQQRVSRIAQQLDELRKRETERPYYAFQDWHYESDSQYAAFAYQASPLTDAADPRVIGWFQWELFRRSKTYGTPEIFPRNQVRLREAIFRAYGEDLRDRLRQAAEPPATRMDRSIDYPLRVVAANEERGKIQEELVDIERQRRGGNQSVENGQQQQYLQQFEQRMDQTNVSVQYSEYAYLARRGTLPGPVLLAWRLVRVPPEHAARRDVRQDRYLIQGYAIDLSSLLPRVGERSGATELATLADLLPGDIKGWNQTGLLSQIKADVATRAAPPLPVDSAPPDATTDPAMVLVSRVPPRLERRAWQTALRRFLLLTGALLGVLATGFFVLYRSFRSEMALVQRKEDFMAAISHELKTPLTGIRMYAEMLKEGWVANPEAAETYATRILQESERLGHLVNQVLDLAALERGVAEFRGQRGDMGSAVRDAVAWMQAKADAADTALRVEVEPNLPLTTFDGQLVRPLVLNLIDNAIKYSAKSQTKDVRVWVRRDVERIVVSVSDQGMGIDAKTRKRLFEPFQRASGELTRDAPGLGIGLALVKRYADAHRARVVVDSEPGRGTTISVRFPIV